MDARGSGTVQRGQRHLPPRRGPGGHPHGLWRHADHRPGDLGAPADPDEARRVLRRAVELGVDFLDTADSYGPFVSEDLIREALHPYDGVTIATRAGLARTGPDQWHPIGRPEYLRQCLEMSLRRLDVEAIDLFQLHRIDRAVAAAELELTDEQLQRLTTMAA